MIDFPASPTIGQQFTAAGVTWVWDGVKWAASGLSVAFLPLAGGNMSGPIVLAADPTANLQAATKQYVDGVRYGDNRLINGDMRIDQRNGGAQGTLAGYTVDRWVYGATQSGKVQWGQAGGPTGFGYCLNVTSSSAYTPLATDLFYLYQSIEADMVSDFAWGSASAQPVTLSFWAYSSKTGSFSGAITNYAGTRSYPFSYSLPTASTWTKLTVTIPGDIAGTWVMKGNAGSVIVYFDVGCGTAGRAAAGAWLAGNFNGVTGAQSIINTNGASYGLTGVKLEIGSVATPFNRQSMAKSMADCQRYYTIMPLWFGAYAGGAVNIGQPVILPVTMRANPTITFNSPTYTNASGLAVAQGSNISPGIYFQSIAAGQVNAQTPAMIASAEL
jgi:hypothetical protein